MNIITEEIRHGEEELTLIKKTYQRNGHKGLAQVFVECNKRGYTGSYDSRCKQIRDCKWNKKRVIQNRIGNQIKFLIREKKYKLILNIF